MCKQETMCFFFNVLSPVIIFHLILPPPTNKKIHSNPLETLEIFLFFFPTSPHLYILSATWYGKQM